MKMLEDDHYFYTLWLDETTGDHYLETVCGGVAVFENAIKLTNKEVAEYIENPESVRSLAQDVVDSPDRFIERRAIIPAS